MDRCRDQPQHCDSAGRLILDSSSPLFRRRRACLRPVSTASSPAESCHFLKAMTIIVLVYVSDMFTQDGAI